MRDLTCPHCGLVVTTNTRDPIVCAQCGHQYDVYDVLTASVERSGLGSGNQKYDKHGLPLTPGEWSRRIEDPNYKRVALTNFGPLIVSTVWLGLDHNWARYYREDADQRPVIFETMIALNQPNTITLPDGTTYTSPWTFDADKHELAGFQRRYCTLEEAIAGHEEVVQMVKDEILPPEAVEWVKQVITEVYRDE